MTARTGLDGRVRPLNSADARRLASDVIAERPEASLREVARATGISPTTVRDVKERMRRGVDPVPARQRIAADDVGRHPDRPRRSPGQDASSDGTADPAATWDRRALLQNLSKDPSLRFTDSGRALLRMLFARAGGPDGWREQVPIIPPHCAYTVAEVARRCAAEWQEFANQLEKRLESTT